MGLGAVEVTGPPPADPEDSSVSFFCCEVLVVDNNKPSTALAGSGLCKAGSPTCFRKETISTIIQNEQINQTSFELWH